MGVLFAHDRVRIHGYSRLLADLGPYTPETFLSGLRKRYTVNPYGHVDGSGYNIRPHIASPENYHIMHLYLEGTWYECCRPVDKDAGSIDVLDVAVLQKHVLEEMLGITDPRGDARLQDLGGTRRSRISKNSWMLEPTGLPLRCSRSGSGRCSRLPMQAESCRPNPRGLSQSFLSGLVIHSFV